MKNIFVILLTILTTLSRLEMISRAVIVTHNSGRCHCSTVLLN